MQRRQAAADGIHAAFDFMSFVFEQTGVDPTSVTPSAIANSQNTRSCELDPLAVSDCQGASQALASCRSIVTAPRAVLPALITSTGTVAFERRHSALTLFFAVCVEGNSQSAVNN